MTLRLALVLWLSTCALSPVASADVGIGAAACDGQCPDENFDVNFLQIATDHTELEAAPAAAPGLPAPPVLVPKFTVDLDKAPEDRWKEVIEYYTETGILKALDAARTYLPKMTPEDERRWDEAILPTVSDEILREARGFAAYAKELDPTLNVTVSRLLSNSHYYEQNYPSFCTGLLAAMPNGTVVHGRNLDYPLKFMWKGKMIGWSEVTVDVTFMKAGKPLFESVTWPSQLGVHTAIRFDGWTLEQNTRDGNTMEENLAAMQQGGLGSSFFMRHLMETVPDYETAVQEIWHAKLAAPQYFILSGAKPWQGGVYAVDRLGLHLPASPPMTQLSSQGLWHIVQTNDDLNHAAEDERRPVAEAKLALSTQSSVDPLWMFAQMRSEPVFNEDTTFTWVGSAALGYYAILLPPNALSPKQYLADIASTR